MDAIDTIGDQMLAARKAAKPTKEELAARKTQIANRLFSAPGITLEELAARINKSIGHISRCELDKEDPSMELLGLISKHTDCRVFTKTVGGTKDA